MVSYARKSAMMPNMVTAMVTVTVVGICEWDVYSILDEVGEHNRNTSESVLGRKLHQLCTHGKVQKRTDVVFQGRSSVSA